ncbi:MAG TPA: DUF1302 family protein [bacterium]|nr:DUF1302 family protein [bacterium]
MRKLRFLLGLLAAGALSAPAVWAEDAVLAPTPTNFVDDLWQNEKVSMVLKSDYFENSKSFNGEQNLWGGTAEMKAFPLISSSIDGKFDVRVMNPNIPNGDVTNFDLLEGYLTFHLGNVDLRLGKQIVAWGRTDGINPTDNLTPHDLTVQLPFDDDMRFGTTALKLDYYLDSEMDLTLFTTPFFQPTKFPLPPTGYTYNQIIPAQTLNNSEVGVRLNKTGGDYDWSVSYFRGYRLLPDVSLEGNNPASSQLNINYSQVDVVGADFAHNIEQYGVRAEVAYVHPTGPDPNDANQINPYLQAVLGVDRTFDQEFNVNVQIIGRFIQNYNAAGPSDPNLQQVYQLNAILNTQQDPSSYEMSFRVSDKWMNEILGAEVFGVVDLTHSDGYFRPSVNYAINDRLKGYVGWDIYYGASNTPFGLLQPTQGFFAEMRYTF